VNGFREVARGVYVLRYPVLDVNVTLVVGGESALVVDTLSTDAQATELLAAARRVTDLPLRVVNTHHHFDHCFGNAVFAAHGAPIWAQEEAAALLRGRGAELRKRWCAEWSATEPELAVEMAAVVLRPPDHTVRVESTVDLGGRVAELHHFGRGHTAGDLVVLVPDQDDGVAAALAGDLVEESGPPQFDDAYPLDWPDTLAAFLSRLDDATAVVPGHGAVVDRRFVSAQHDQLAALDWLIREGDEDGAPAARVAARSPFDAQTSLVAVRRGYDQLAGRG
jgi:glyoxylase-like metal-dependent hydrolase (beta-lactamase superfamily II)